MSINTLLKVALESTEEAVIAETASKGELQEAHIEAEEAHQEVQSVIEAESRLSTAADALGALQTIPVSGDGSIAAIANESILLSIGVEGLGLEEAESTLSKLWLSIKNFFSRIWTAIQNFFGMLFNAAKKYKDKLIELKAELKKSTKKEGVVIKGHVATQLSFKGKSNSIDAVQGLRKLVNLYASSAKTAGALEHGIEKTISELEARLGKAGHQSNDSGLDEIQDLAKNFNLGETDQYIGEYHVDLIKDSFGGVQVLVPTYKTTDAFGKATEFKIESKKDLEFLIDIAINGCDIMLSRHAIKAALNIKAGIDMMKWHEEKHKLTTELRGLYAILRLNGKAQGFVSKTGNLVLSSVRAVLAVSITYLK